MPMSTEQVTLRAHRNRFPGAPNRRVSQQVFDVVTAIVMKESLCFCYRAQQKGVCLFLFVFFGNFRHTHWVTLPKRSLRIPTQRSQKGPPSILWSWAPKCQTRAKSQRRGTPFHGQNALRFQSRQCVCVCVSTQIAWSTVYFCFTRGDPSAPKRSPGAADLAQPVVLEEVDSGFAGRYAA